MIRIKTLADSVACHLEAGDVVALSGPLGGGKTTLAASIIKSMAGVDLGVVSPTYQLIKIYRMRVINVAHVDLYRLHSAMELNQVGLGEIIDTHVTLIEWPDLIRGIIEDKALFINIEMLNDPALRQISISSALPKWQQIISVFS